MKTNLFILTAGLLLATIGIGLGQPVINQQPQSQSACLESTVTFTVGATGTEPLSYQWQYSFDYYNYVNLPDATNTSLVITNFHSSDASYYRVVVTNFQGATTSIVAIVSTAVLPIITVQPTNFLVVSLGANVTNRLIAGGTAPISYQWRLNGTDLPGQTKNTIILTNLQAVDEGNYDVIVSNTCGSVASSAVTLKVDPTFTKITSGPIATDAEGSCGGNWADYDGDGFVDVFVANTTGSGTVRNALYHNEHGTNFTRVTTGPPATDYMRAWMSGWADYDNDGNLDLIVANLEGGVGAQRLYRNNGNGIFTVVVDAALRSDTTRAISPWWFDYNADGFLDLLVGKGIYWETGANDCLFRNNGDGTFRKMTVAEIGPMLNDQLRTETVFSIDYNNDGRQEVTICHDIPLGGNLYNLTNYTWRPQPDGTFGSVPAPLPQSAALQWWADYNNDGWLDVLGGDVDYHVSLFRNLGVAGFSEATTALNLVTTNLIFLAAWGDYDNDGWLDLYYTGARVAWPSAVSGLFHNNGDGTFTQVLTGSPVSDRGHLCSPSWADYNNDGFLDLFVAVGNGGLERNLLYRNNGNTNHWLKVKLEGRASNCSGIGARVRANATVGGRNFWQTRDITCGNDYHGQNGLLAHFGLGDATKVATLRIEWPSGIVQELQNVPANQFLTVVESQGYRGAAPELGGVTNGADGLLLSFTEPDAGACYTVEASTNLIDWTKLVVRTSAGVTTNYTDTRATNYARRFYRILVP